MRIPVHQSRSCPDFDFDSLSLHERTCSRQGCSEGKCSTGSGIQVRPLQQLVWFASFHGLSSPTRHESWNALCRSQELQVPIIHWTCRHVYWDPSPTLCWYPRFVKPHAHPIFVQFDVQFIVVHIIVHNSTIILR